MTDAYSLIRMSTLGQAKGDSTRRQELLTVSDKFCADHGLNLVDTLRVIGKSAFHGHHVASGPLSDFLKLVESGGIKPGCWLLRQFLSLLEAGIVIHTFIDNQTYTLDRVNEDQTALIISIVKMAAAHDYSKKLSNRIKSVWTGRREAMRAGNGRATNACPAWLQAVNGKFVLRPDRVAIVKRIIADRHLGLGRKAIATRLNDPNQSGGRVPTFKRGFGWHPTTIALLVKSQALIGVYQPHKAGGIPDGDPIEGFYPRIISDEDYWRAQWGPDNKLSRGRTTKGLWNLLKGVVKCGCCGCTIIGLNTGKHEHSKFLICDKARYSLCENRRFISYPKFESELLSALVLFDFSRLLERVDPEIERIAGLEAEIAAKTATVERLIRHFTANTPALVLKQIETLSAEVDARREEVAKARRVARIAEAQATKDAYAEFRQMVESLPRMTDDDSRFRLRARIAAELRGLIESATANSTELTIALKRTEFYRVELLFKRSEFDELRLVSLNGGCTCVFRRDLLIGDPDVAGLFAGYIGSQNACVAA
jgi:Recombinase